MELFFDYILPFATVNHFPTKKIYDRCAVFDIKYQIAYFISINKNRHITFNYLEFLNFKIIFVIITDKTTNITHGNFAIIFKNKKLFKIENNILPPTGNKIVIIKIRKDGNINYINNKLYI